MRSKRIFISYKHYEVSLDNRDETVARKLYDKLCSAGFECWMDKMNMPVVTDSWINDIVTAIEKCDLVVMVVSKHSQESKTIRLKELRVISDNDKPIIPFRIDRSRLLPEFQWEMSSKQWVAAWDDYETKIDELISKMRLQLGDPKDPTPKKQKQVKEATEVTETTKNHIVEINIDPSSEVETKKSTESPQTEIISVPRTNVSFKMVYVQGGTFIMGAEEEDDDASFDEKPAHEVTLSDYWIGETPVTQELWEAVMRKNPSWFQGNPNLPVESVSWDDCQVFILELNKLTGKKFHLPTEAQWEFAARGGNLGKDNHYLFSGSNDNNVVAWHKENSFGTPHPVGKLNPNELGLYDMSGNVWEWCQDWYDENHYSDSSANNPQGPVSGLRHIIRGGSWYNYAKFCRVSNRHSNDPTFKRSRLGLRLTLDIDQKPIEVKKETAGIDKAMELFSLAAAEEDTIKAIELYARAIEMRADFYEAYINRGILKRYLGDLEGAMQDFNQVIELNPNISESYVYRGILKDDLGDMQGAMQDFDKAILLNPNNTKAYINRGNLKEVKGDKEGAVQDYNQAIKLKGK